MTLVEFYPHIKTTHIALVATSGLLFALRGAAVLAGQCWPMHRALRLTSVTIDTVLLAAGVALWSQLGLHPGRDAWLGAKLVLLVLYIMLGSLALKRASTARVRALALAAAIACYLFMVSVAVAHHPLGALSRWLG